MEENAHSDAYSNTCQQGFVIRRQTATGDAVNRHRFPITSFRLELLVICPTPAVIDMASM